METSSAQGWPKLGMVEDRDFVGFSEPTAEQLEVLMGYHNNFADESLMTGYPRNLKLPTTVSQLGGRPSAGSLGYERPAKQSKPNNSVEDSSFQCQQTFSGKLSTPLPICVPNIQQKPQHIQLENFFRDFFKPKAHQTYESLALTSTPCMQTEILAGSGAHHDHSCISDISHSNNDGHSDMQISSVPARSRQSNQVQNKASGNSQDHIMAERKRREKLGQRFIALSAIVPGLKKMDKISVLGDAIKYVKQLLDKIKTLEEQTPKTTVQSVVYVKKKEIRRDDEEDSDKVSSPSNDSSADKDVTEGGVVLTPEIEIRVTNRNVLIHAHCQKRKGLLPKFVAELDALQLTVLNANILSFSEATFDLTFNTQMEEGCELTVRDRHELFFF